MTTPTRYSSGRLALTSLTTAAAVAAVHHIYRLGPAVLVPGIIVTLLPFVLLRHYRSSGSRLALWSYPGLTSLLA